MIKEVINNSKHISSDATRKPVRIPHACENCISKASQDNCNHCFICGSSDHFARRCMKRRQQGNRGASPKGRCVATPKESQVLKQCNFFSTAKNVNFCCSKCNVSYYCRMTFQNNHRAEHTPFCNALHILNTNNWMDHHNEISNCFHLIPKEEVKILQIIGNKCMINSKLNGKETSVLWDTGFQISIVASAFFEATLSLFTVGKVGGNMIGPNTN